MRARPLSVRLLAPAVAFALVSVAGPHALAGAATGGSVAAPAAAAPGTPGARRVLLPDGEQVQLLPSGAVVSTAGSPRLLTQAGGHSRALPLRTGPLGRMVDPAAFDVQALAELEAGNSGNLPLAVTYTGVRPDLPGLSWTGATSGYLTPASAAAFGEALRAKDPAGVTRIALPGVPGVTPAYVMHTVSFRAITAGLATETGYLRVQNVDDVDRWSADAYAFPGFDSRLSLPAGHYAVTGLFVDSDGGSRTARLVTVPLTVSGDTVLTLDARTANVPLTVATPRRARLLARSVNLAVLDAVGRLSAFTLIQYEPYLGRLLVAPTPAGSPLRLRYQPYFHLESDQSAPDPYTYDVAFPSSTISADQHYVVTPGSLAAVRTRFFADAAAPAPATYGSWPQLRGPRNDQLAGGGAKLFPVRLGTTRTQYTSTGSYWSSYLDAEGVGSLSGPERSFAAGSSPTVDWLRSPLRPGAAQLATPGRNVTDPHSNPDCALCRRDNRFHFGLYPLTDPDGNVGFGYGGSVAWTLTADGRPVAAGTAAPAPTSPPVAVPPAAATYALRVEVRRSAARLSTLTRTTWTFPSGPSSGRPQGTTVRCLDGIEFLVDCRVQDLLQVAIELPVDLQGREAAGPTTAAFVVDQVPGATSSPLRGLRAQVSFDDGASWQPTTLATAGNGRYQVAYGNPAGARSVSLRVHAEDANGSAFDQTVVRAYTVR